MDQDDRIWRLERELEKATNQVAQLTQTFEQERYLINQQMAAMVQQMYAFNTQNGQIQQVVIGNNQQLNEMSAQVHQLGAYLNYQSQQISGVAGSAHNLQAHVSTVIGKYNSDLQTIGVHLQALHAGHQGMTTEIGKLGEAVGGLQDKYADVSVNVQSLERLIRNPGGATRVQIATMSYDSKPAEIPHRQVKDDERKVQEQMDADLALAVTAALEEEDAVNKVQEQVDGDLAIAMDLDERKEGVRKDAPNQRFQAPNKRKSGLEVRAYVKGFRAEFSKEAKEEAVLLALGGNLTHVSKDGRSGTVQFPSRKVAERAKLLAVSGMEVYPAFNKLVIQDYLTKEQLQARRDQLREERPSGTSPSGHDKGKSEAGETSKGKISSSVKPSGSSPGTKASNANQGQNHRSEAGKGATTGSKTIGVAKETDREPVQGKKVSHGSTGAAKKRHDPTNGTGGADTPNPTGASRRRPVRRMDDQAEARRVSLAATHDLLEGSYRPGVKVLNEALSKMTKRGKCNNVLGDGRCQSRAVWNSLRRRGLTGDNYEGFMNKLVVTLDDEVLLRTVKEHLDDEFTGVRSDWKHWAIEHVFKRGKEGDDITLLMIAYAWKCTIFVWDAMEGKLARTLVGGNDISVHVGYLKDRTYDIVCEDSLQVVGKASGHYWDIEWVDDPKGNRGRSTAPRPN